MITIHTPKGAFTFDPSITTDKELKKMGTKREYLPAPIELSSEDRFVSIEKRLANLEGKDN